MLIEVFLGVISVLLFWMVLKKPTGLPPGKWGLPLIGWLPENGKYIDETLKDLQRQYGDIYVWRFGTRVQIYIHDYHLMKKLFSSPDCADRPDMESLKAFEEVGLGVAPSSGAIWQTNRRFMLHHLRDLGMGKSHLLDAIHKQTHMLVDALKEKEGKPAPITDVLYFATMNVIWKMTANKHFDVTSPKHKYLQKLLKDLTIALKPVVLADMMPWVREYLPSFFFRKIFNHDEFRETIDKLFEFFQEMIDEHKENLDPYDPKDLIDAYLLEMTERQDSPQHPRDSNGVRSEQDLKYVLLDAIIGGSDPAYLSTKWIILYMAAHQEKQRKLQEELDNVLGKDNLFTFEDKTKLPYTEAVINEVLRAASQDNTGFPRCPNRDIELAGYIIPKGCLVIPAAYSIHHDPRYWKEPEVFSPERWLSPEGKFAMKKEGFMAFGTGKRSCVGEGLGRMELAVFTTAIFQNFTVTPPEGEKVDLLPNYNNLILHTPRDQDIVFKCRNREK